MYYVYVNVLIYKKIKRISKKMNSKMSLKELQAKVLAVGLKTYGIKTTLSNESTFLKLKKLKTTYVDQCKTWIKLIVERKWILFMLERNL